MKDGIVLLAKKRGPTSFSSLVDVKKALGTSKVGHTGTLDSFAEGLLVVCTGHLTKLAGNITAFDKSYQAVIKFGSETDTLECSGNIIRQAPLPKKDDFEKAVKKFTGEIYQSPPLFSAIHINGKRASDIARSGSWANLPSRKVTVYKSEIIELKLTKDNLVEYAELSFSVSKGTYIRSLARDIALECQSAGHLIALRRTRVGNFQLKDAVGFSLLNDFNIENAIKDAEAATKTSSETVSRTVPKTSTGTAIKSTPKSATAEQEKFQEEIKDSIKTFDFESAKLCGFEIIKLSSNSYEADFQNGKKLSFSMFQNCTLPLKKNTQIAVFSTKDIFMGLIFINEKSHLEYKFVIPKETQKIIMNNADE